VSEERAPAEFMEIFLQPGECYFSDADTRLRTLLGSCVSITMWHPARKLGGMCHYLLPTRIGQEQQTLDARYGDEALFLLLREARQLGCRPRDFHFKVFGGARMIEREECGGRPDVGTNNIRQAMEMLADLGIHAHGQDVGGCCARTIMLDNWSGDVWVRSSHDLAAALKGDQRLIA